MKEIIDISLSISPHMLIWPKDPPVQVDPARRIAKGDGANVSQLTMGSHTGTHVDPPFHFIDGAAAVDQISLNSLIGPAVVADFQHVDAEITVADLEKAQIPEGAQRLLCKTRNSQLWNETSPPFPDKYTAVGKEAASWLVEHQYKLVGVDFLSVETRGTPGHPTHKTLLGAKIVIIEGLDLRKADPGEYELICLPLKIEGGDGAPARAVLLR